MQGALVGGLLLGVVNALVGRYVSSNYQTVIAFTLLLALLTFRPQGITGKHWEERPKHERDGKGRVAGKVALITGGARNMGLSHGRLLAEQGASVILADVTDEAARREAASAAGRRSRYPLLSISTSTQPETGRRR